jgi:hypothetical protein
MAVDVTAFADDLEHVQKLLRAGHKVVFRGDPAQLIYGMDFVAMPAPQRQHRSRPSRSKRPCATRARRSGSNTRSRSPGRPADDEPDPPRTGGVA